MNFTGLMGSAAIIGVVAAFWDKIKFAYNRVLSFAVVTVYVDDDLARGCLMLINNNFKRSPYGPQTFSSYWRYVRPIKSYQEIAYEKFYNKDATLYWDGWKPIVVQETPENNAKKESSPYNRSEVNLTIKFIRGTWDIRLLMLNSIKAYNDLWSLRKEANAKSLRRFFVHKYVGAGKKTTTSGNTIKGYQSQSNTLLSDATVKFIGYTMNDIGIEQYNKESAINALALPDEIIILVDELKLWYERKDWYKARNISWRRGWLLHGKPGNGKTSIVRALAMDMDMPIFSFDLSSMSNMELTEAWSQTRAYSPCIALFEDIDAVFDKRVNITGEQGGGLTFDCLLNCLNGAEDNDGIFTVITTNYISKVDDAIAGFKSIQEIASRPGRIDRIIEINNPNETCRTKIANRILADWPHQINEIVLQGNGDSSAQFQERCVEFALNNLKWVDNHDKERKTLESL